MLHRYVLHNDSLHDASEPVLAPGQVGLLAGWGVFTTLKIAEGVPFAWERHWARILRDAAAFRVEVPADPDQLRRKLVELIEANHAQNSTLRLAIVRNTGSMWAGPAGGRASDVIALTADSKDWGEGVKLGYVTNGRHAACEFAGTKILSWAMNLRWVEEAQARGLDEVILLNEHGEVAECTSANIFVANGSQVWTPPLSAGCLPGVTREILLSEIHIPGISIGEKRLTPGELEAAEEVFITSTTRDLLPVALVEKKTVGGSHRVREELNRAFGVYVRQYIESHRTVAA